MEALAADAMSLLQQEADLREIVRLVGAEALSPQERLTLDSARMLREDFLHQTAFHAVDTFTSMTKQYEMLKTVLYFHRRALEAVEQDVETSEIFKLHVREEIARAKFIREEEMEKITKLRDTIDEQMGQLQPSAA
jgi:V/A-type H+-transporting ATPase subunit A